MAQEGVNLPGGFGGLVRFKEEYDSKINFSPSHIILFIVLIILFRISLSLFFKTG